MLFFALQCLQVVRAQFVEARDFCWAPHTTQVKYSIRTEVAGTDLTDQEIAWRYQIPASGWEAHSYQNLINLIAQRERTYGRNDGARVWLTYSINGRQPRLWVWPEQ